MNTTHGHGTRTHARAALRRGAAGAALGAGALALLAGPLGAQSGQTRPAGDYILVGGATTSGFANVVYVLDTANRELVALQWNDSTKSLDGTGYRDLVADLDADSER